MKEERHSFSDPRPLTEGSNNKNNNSNNSSNNPPKSSSTSLPTWQVDVFREGVPEPVGTLLINQETLPPRMRKNKVVWKLPDTIEEVPRFGTDEKRRLLDLFKLQKKEQRKGKIGKKGGSVNDDNQEEEEEQQTKTTTSTTTTATKETFIVPDNNSNNNNNIGDHQEKVTVAKTILPASVDVSTPTTANKIPIAPPPGLPAPPSLPAPLPPPLPPPGFVAVNLISPTSIPTPTASAATAAAASPALHRSTSTSTPPLSQQQQQQLLTPLASSESARTTVTTSLSSDTKLDVLKHAPLHHHQQQQHPSSPPAQQQWSGQQPLPLPPASTPTSPPQRQPQLPVLFFRGPTLDAVLQQVEYMFYPSSTPSSVDNQDNTTAPAPSPRSSPPPLYLYYAPNAKKSVSVGGVFVSCTNRAELCRQVVSLQQSMTQQNNNTTWITNRLVQTIPSNPYSNNYQEEQEDEYDQHSLPGYLLLVLTGKTLPPQPQQQQQQPATASPAVAPIPWPFSHTLLLVATGSAASARSTNDTMGQVGNEDDATPREYQYQIQNDILCLFPNS